MNSSLLEQTKCTKFLYTKEMSQKVHELQSEKNDLQIQAVGSLDEMIQNYGKRYPYEASFAKNRWNPVLILHSSGSTGEISYKLIYRES